MSETDPSRIGDYVVERRIAGGPTDVTYEATHVLLPRRATLKVMHPAFQGLRPVAVQMMREACILEALRHPGVPRVYECGVLPDRRPWVAIEIVDGITVADSLERPMALTAVKALLRDVAEVLDYAHRRGVVHRGLRPAAVVRCSDLRGFGVCITGWGEARAHDSGLRDRAGTIPPPVGDDPYRAPEVVASEAFDGRADVYSLGVIAYQAMTLELPGPRPRRSAHVPPRLAMLVERMLAIDPVIRPSSAEVRAEAMRLVEGNDSVLDDVTEVEEEEVVLVELPEGPPPLPLDKVRWTPPQGLGTARTPPRGTQPIASDLKRR
jgi:eukaryotic-like serine/threonine-protein kinase